MGCSGFFVQCQTPGAVKFPRSCAPAYGAVVINYAAEAHRRPILSQSSDGYRQDQDRANAYRPPQSSVFHKISWFETGFSATSSIVDLPELAEIAAKWFEAQWRTNGLYMFWL